MKILATFTVIAAALVLPVVAVTAPPSLTLAASPLSVTYGGTTTLSGKVSLQRAGEDVDILAQECGTTAFKRLASVPTTSGGTFTYAAKPTKNTAYRARLRGSTSPTLQIKVAPVVKLRKIRLGRYSFTVTAADSFVGKYVVFQRLRNGKWVTLKARVTLKTVKTTTAPTQVSSSTLRIRMKRGLRLRAVLPQAQAGTCYVATKSLTIRS
jgi:hypothetical protein